MGPRPIKEKQKKISPLFSVTGDWGCWAVLGLAILLRVVGLRWGIPTPELPHAPFHPDESWAISVLKELNFGAGKFNPLAAHREGTLAYYLWTFVFYAGYFMGALKKLPFELTAFDADYAAILLTGRTVTAVCDALAVIPIYFCLKKLSGRRAGAAFGALVFALTPFEIIYAHYLRTHALSNLLVVVAIFASYHLYDRVSSRRLWIVGGLCGLCTAAKYPGIVALACPAAILWNVLRSQDPKWAIAWRRIPSIYWKRCGLLFLGFLIGFFIADPFLFIKYDAARKAIEEQLNYVAVQEFSFSNLFDVSRLWYYLLHLIPAGSLPFLWVVFYAACGYLVFQREWYRKTVPLALVLVAYLYPMAKGYCAGPTFIRGAILAFPLFALFSGIAFDSVWQRVKGDSVRASWFVAALAVILTASLGYDLAYVTAMTRTDARVQLVNFLTDQTPESKPVVGYYEGGHSYFITTPVIEAATKKKLAWLADQDLLRNKDGYKLVDYLVLYAFEEGNEEANRKEIEFLEKSGKFLLLRVFENPISFGGFIFDFPTKPHDLQYPFAKMYLLRSLSPVSDRSS